MGPPLWSEAVMMWRCFGEHHGVGKVTRTEGTSNARKKLPMISTFLSHLTVIRLSEMLSHAQIFIWFFVRQWSCFVQTTLWAPPCLLSDAAARSSTQWTLSNSAKAVRIHVGGNRFLVLPPQSKALLLCRPSLIKMTGGAELLRSGMIRPVVGNRGCVQSRSWVCLDQQLKPLLTLLTS